MKNAKNGMAFTPRKWRCSDVDCAMRPRFNVEGSKSGIFCKQHAEDAMVNVVSKRCAYEFCLTWPMVNVKGTETVLGNRSSQARRLHKIQHKYYNLVAR